MTETQKEITELPTIDACINHIFKAQNEDTEDNLQIHSVLISIKDSPGTVVLISKHNIARTHVLPDGNGIIKEELFEGNRKEKIKETLEDIYKQEISILRLL